MATVWKERNKMNKAMGYIYLVLTFVIWGSLYVAAKSVMTEIPPLAVLASRYLIAVIALFFVMRKRGFKKIKKEHRLTLFLVGFIGYFCGIAFQLAGTDMIDASLSSLINSLNPVVIPIIAAMFLNERLTVRTCISIALSVVGVYIILGIGDGGSFWGIAVNILSLVFWSASCCMVRSISQEYDPIQTTLYAMAIALCFAVPTAVYSIAATPCSLSGTGAVSLLYIGLVCTALSHVFWNRSLKILPATTCSLFYPIQPLTSALLAIIVLGEELTLSFVIGAVIICLSMVIVVFQRARNSNGGNIRFNHVRMFSKNKKKDCEKVQ